MKKVIRLDEKDIKILVNKIIKEEKVITELDWGDVRVVKVLDNMCELEGGYKVAIAETRGVTEERPSIRILVILDGDNQVSITGPNIEYLKDKPKEVVCNIARQLMDELIVEGNKPLKKSCWKGYEAVGMKTKNGKKVPNCVPIKESHTGSIIDMEGVTDNLVNKLVSNNFSDDSISNVYDLLRKTLMGRTVQEKIDLYKLMSVKLDKYKDNRGQAQTYRYLTDRMESDLLRENDEERSNNYMFWQNLETIKNAVDEMLAMDREEVDEMLSNGHGWALDHLATSTDDIEEVYHFLEGNDEEEYEGEMENEYEAFQESKRGSRLIEQDEFGSVELMIEGKKGDCSSRKLNTPWLTPDGPKKRSVCVKNGEGNVVKVNFGDPNMTIKKSNPERRKSFRARHRCENPGPKWKARYWSCKAW